MIPVVLASALFSGAVPSPNYAERLLPPFDGADTIGELRRVWRRFPVRVTVDDAGTEYSASRFACVQRACERWRRATAPLRGGGVSFVVNHGPFSSRTQIEVRLKRNEDMESYGGFTRQVGPERLSIDLSVTRTSGEETADWLLERVATHELGHALGIVGHSPDSNDIMSLHYESTAVTVADVNTLRIAYGAY